MGLEGAVSMVDERTLLLYLPAMLAITLAPGADTLFVVASALRSGARGGVLAATGIISGGIVHITAATIGLSALILKSALAFAILKYVGAAYLIYLGIRALLSRETPETSEGTAEKKPVSNRVFFQGFITNVTNPKVAIFMLAFLPQFVSPARGPIWTQLLELGGLWYIAGLIWLGAVGFAVGKARRSVSASKSIRNAFKYVTASIFIGLGLRVAVSNK